MKPGKMDSKFCLTLLVLGLTAIIGTEGTALGAKQDDRIYQQDVSGAAYRKTDNKVDGPQEEQQLPFYYNNNFDCSKYQYAYGMYADMDFQCQVYHVCHNNRKETFVCPQGTLFNQRLLVCDHWYSVNCQNTPSFYYVNEELGKVSNRTRFDSTDRPSWHRRLPQDYGRGNVPSHTAGGQGQFISYYGTSTQLPSPYAPTEAPHEPSIGRYHPQTTRYEYPQPDQQNRLSPGYGHQPSRSNAQGQRDIYGQQRPGTGARGSLYGERQPPFIQPTTSFPRTQQNHSGFTRYSQTGFQRPHQGRRANTTWPADQRNTSQGIHYGRQPSLRYGQTYPESSLLGARYGGSQYGQQQPDRSTLGLSQDGHLGSNIPTSDLAYDNEVPSIGMRGQRYPGQDVDRGYRRGLPSGSPDADITQYGQEGPHSRSPGLPYRPHHPFTTHGGQIHQQTGTTDSTYDHQQPIRYGQQPPQARRIGSGYDELNSTFLSPYGRQRQYGITRPPHHRQPSTSWSRQNQSYTTPSPIYGQQPVIPHYGVSAGTDSRQQGPRRIIEQGHQYTSQGNRTQFHNEQNFTTSYQPHVAGSVGRKPEFGYRGQPLNHQHERKPEYGIGQTTALDDDQGTQYNRNSKAVHVQPPRRQPVDNLPWRSQYSWQKPGSPQYSFQQPQYRNLHFSRSTATSQLSPGGDKWNLANGTEDETHLRTYNENWNTSERNKTTGRQEVPVYKVYYVRGNQKETAVN